MGIKRLHSIVKISGFCERKKKKESLQKSASVWIYNMLK